MLHLIPFDRLLLERFAAAPPDLRRRARLVGAVSFLGVVGGGTLFLSHVLGFRIPIGYALAPLVAAVGSLFVPLLLRRTGSLVTGAHAVAACWFVAISWGVYLRGGLASPPLMCQRSYVFPATLSLFHPM